MSIWDFRISTGVSVKRPGWAEPAQFQTMSGGWLLFHVFASASIWAPEEAEVRSALMWWKRWVEGDLAAALQGVSEWVRRVRVRVWYGDLCFCCFKGFGCSGNDDYVGAFLSQ